MCADPLQVVVLPHFPVLLNPWQVGPQFRCLQSRRVQEPSETQAGCSTCIFLTVIPHAEFTVYKVTGHYTKEHEVTYS
jgi:hypothetical protein